MHTHHKEVMLTNHRGSPLQKDNYTCSGVSLVSSGSPDRSGDTIGNLGWARVWFPPACPYKTKTKVAPTAVKQKHTTAVGWVRHTHLEINILDPPNSHVSKRGASPGGRLHALKQRGLGAVAVHCLLHVDLLVFFCTGWSLALLMLSSF